MQAWTKKLSGRTKCGLLGNSENYQKCRRQTNLQGEILFFSPLSDSS